MQTIVILLALLCAVVIAAICCKAFSKRASRAHSYIFNNVVLNECGITRGSYLAKDGCYRTGMNYNDESVVDMRWSYEVQLDWFERFVMPEIGAHPSYWYCGLVSPATWRNLKALCCDVANYVRSYLRRAIKSVEHDALAIRLARRAHDVNVSEGLVYYNGVAQNRY